MASDLILLNTDINYWKTQSEKYEIMFNFVTCIIQDENNIGEGTLSMPDPLKQTMFYARGLMGMTYLLLVFSKAMTGTTVPHLFELANFNKEGLALLLTNIIDNVIECTKEKLVTTSEDFPWGEENEI